MIVFVKIKELIRLMEAWIMLLLARLILVSLPFKKVTFFLGKRDVLPFDAFAVNPQFKYNVITKAITTAGKISPWRTKCFEQAIAAKFMLFIRGKECLLFLGIKKNVVNKIVAHAWVVSENKVITGGWGLSAYTVMVMFKSK